VAIWLWTFVVETWKVFYEASLFILFGFLIAGAIHYWISPQRITRLLGRRKFSSIVLASIAGIPLPLCSCSVVPAALALRKGGASKGATCSFLISTPETSAESIALTYGLMDLPMTLFRPIAALITGLFAGVATELFGGEPQLGETPNAAEGLPVAPKQAGEVYLKQHPNFTSAFWELFNEISHWLLIGLILSGLIAALVPASAFERILGSGIWSMLLVLAVSVPLYICASGSTPIAAALILKGMSPGTALVFLLAGPATNIAAIMVLWRLLGRRVLFIYLLSIIIVALILGLYVDSYYESRGIDPRVTMAQPSQVIPGWVKVVSALVLIGMLTRSVWRVPLPAELRTLARWGRQGLEVLRLSPRQAAGVLALLILLSYLLTCFLVVRPGESGIVMRFGRIVRRDLPAGLHLHWPYPFEVGQLCEVGRVRMLQVGFVQEVSPLGAVVYPPVAHRRYLGTPNRTELQPMNKIEREAYFLTGDENLIDIQAVVQYRVADPIRFQYGLEEPERLVRNHSIWVLVELFGTNRIDEIYTSLRGAIEQEGTRRLKTVLAEQNTGIELLNLFLVDVHAPPEVHDAFRDFASAHEDKARAIHDAQGAASQKVFSASGEGSQALYRAEVGYVDQVLQGEGESEAYLLNLEQYAFDPDSMELRLLYETYARVLPAARLYLLPPGVQGPKLALWHWEGGGPAPRIETVEPARSERPTLEELLRRR